MTIYDTNSWQGIKSEVIRRINDRQWQPGDLIPSEVELSEQFGCARATVNRALQDLADAGVLDRRRKAGTRVALNPVRKATLEIPVIRKDAEARGGTYSFDLLSQQEFTPSANLQNKYRFDPNISLVGLYTLHRANLKPFAYEERWINLAVVPEITQADLTSISANEWLVNHTPLSRGEFGFSATNATKPEALLLQCDEGAALFTVNRVTWSGEAPITAVRLVYAPGYSMVSIV